MELKDLYKLIKRNKTLILAVTALGLAAGVICYFLPDKYYASGSFYIGRSTDESVQFFAYEGYYAQQTAVSYTNTVIALFESIDLQSSALRKLKINVNENTLRKYSRDIKVKKSGPQLVTLTVKSDTSDTAAQLWNTLAVELSDSNFNVSKISDPKLNITKVAESPVIKKTYKSLWISIPAGLLIGLASGLFFASIKEYD